MAVYNIVFQSNSIDGWFSAYLAAGAAACHEEDLVFFHPIDARTPDTWPSHEKLVPASVLNKPTTGTELPTRQQQTNNKAFCYFIDCTPTIPDGTICSEWLLDISKHFNCMIIDNSPMASLLCDTSTMNVKCDPTRTTISLVWEHFGCSSSSMPDWVQQIDRIESWKMEDNDAAIREILLDICRLPTTGRIQYTVHETEEYLAAFENAESMAELIAKGDEKLKLKISGFAPLLAATRSVELDATLCYKWGFPLQWIGKTFLYVNSTGHSPDSSELAACALAKFGGSAFVNFRQRRHPGGETFYVYSARRSPIDTINLVEDGSPFKGYDKSAGAIISAMEERLPFIRM
jgi:hypothetical protein